MYVKRLNLCVVDILLITASLIGLFSYLYSSFKEYKNDKYSHFLSLEKKFWDSITYDSDKWTKMDITNFPGIDINNYYISPIYGDFRLVIVTDYRGLDSYLGIKLNKDDFKVKGLCRYCFWSFGSPARKYRKFIREIVTRVENKRRIENV